ncbi:hypothetical protein F2Q70_00045618 [Brassica cretica]|uniref:SLC26A/SulP transporter domain-containing protein n=1 Tax=Brassica cretica TaxID=69181 RepID=A0A8S9KH22_BRACR|nr:hypothetical protein F2Q70_00045618 [Brassica cretica]
MCIRLGFLVDFLSHAALVGFMAGAAIVIGLQQLKGLFGLSRFTNKTDVVSVLSSVFHSLHHPWQPLNFVIGSSFLIFILLARFLGKRNKKLFWIPAMAPLISVILATLIVYLTNAETRGVKIVKNIKPGFNRPSVNQLEFNGSHLGQVAKIGIICAIIALTTYVPITSAFTINGQQLPPSVLAIRRNEAHNLRTVNNSARHHVIMQRRVYQSSSSFRVSSLYTLLRRRPSANSSIPPQNEVIGSRRRTYESRFQFGEPSSSTRRRRTTPADGSVGSTAINPTGESLLRVRPKRSQARGSRYTKFQCLPAPATCFPAGAGLSRRRCLLPSSDCSLLTSNFRCYGVVAFCKPKKGIPDGAFVGDMSFGSSFPL